jgi:transcriptional regulator with XRE-family HTH domain
MSSADSRRPDPFDVMVGARVRLTRRLRGISQEKLAQACGLTFQQVQKYEKGTNRISCSMLKRISECLQTPMAELLGEDDAAPRSTNWPMLAEPMVQELTEAFAAIKSRALKRRVLHLLHELAEQPPQAEQAKHATGG